MARWLITPHTKTLWRCMLLLCGMVPDAALPYALSLSSYQRRASIAVQVGSVGIGGANPIRIQSMTTIDTMDTAGSIAQSIRMIEAGAELVRITAPSIKEAANLEHIRAGLRAAGYNTPLVADIHFTPNAAELAARLVEKVRINPGNYADKKKFDHIAYTDASYEAELERIRAKLDLLGDCRRANQPFLLGAILVQDHFNVIRAVQGLLLAGRNRVSWH